MKKYLIILFLWGACAGENLLIKGEMIDALWNGVYNQAITGDAKIIVGDKSLEIQNIATLENGVYELFNIVNQKPIFRAWIKKDQQFIAIEMNRNKLSDLETHFLMTHSASEMKSFPQIFEITITMIRE